MRLFKILIALLFLSNVAIGQTPKPSGFPITTSTGWVRYGWVQTDSGFISALRDTNFLPRFAGTKVYWQHAGVDSSEWIYNGRTTGKRWDKSGSGSSGGASAVNVNDSIRTSKFYPWAVFGLGDSHMSGAVPGPAYAPWYLASQQLNFSFTNLALGGSSCMYPLYRTYTGGHQQFDIDTARAIQTGTNNISQGASTLTPVQMQNVYRALITNQFLDTALPANDALLTKVGTWSTYNTYTNGYGKAPFLNGGAGLGMTTSTVGDSITWTTPVSTTISITGFGTYDNSLGSYLTYIDGVLVDTVICSYQTTNIVSVFDPFGVSKIQLCRNYANLSNTTHNVVIKNLSGTIIIDYVGTLQDDYTRQSPIYITSTNRAQAKGWGNLYVQGGNSLVEECNSQAKKVIEEFRTMNQNWRCYYIDVNKSIDYNTDFYTDGLHLTSMGTKKQAADIVNFLTTPLSQYNAIDQPYTNLVAIHDYPPLAGVTLEQPTGVGQDNIGTIRMGTDVFLRWYNNNIGLGKQAWNGNSTAINSIAIGDGSQSTNQTVGWNTTVGVQTGLNLSNGTRNLFESFQAGLSATSASDNNVEGYRAFVNSTDGGDNNLKGTQIFLNGVHINRNNASGTNFMYNNEGSDNSGLAHFGGFGCTGCDADVILGSKAAYNAATMDYSIIIGAGVDAPSSSAAGQLNIGNVIYGSNLYQSLTPSSTPTTTGTISIGTSTSDSMLHVAKGILGERGLRLPNLPSSNNANDSVVVWNPTTGTVGKRAIPSGVNIYNAGGDLTSDRILNGNNIRSLTFQDLSSFSMNTNATTTLVYGNGSSMTGNMTMQQSVTIADTLIISGNVVKVTAPLTPSSSSSDSVLVRDGSGNLKTRAQSDIGSAGTATTIGNYNIGYKLLKNPAANTVKSKSLIPDLNMELDSTRTDSTILLRPTGGIVLTSAATRTLDITLTDVIGLNSINVEAGVSYKFEARLYTTSNSSGGVNFAIGGTATATSIIYEVLTTNAGTTTQGRATALNTGAGGVTAVTAAYAVISGTIVVNAAGSLTVQFGQNSSNGSASTILAGSTFYVTKVL